MVHKESGTYLRCLEEFEDFKSSVEKALEHVTFSDDLEHLLRQVKKDLIYFYTMKLYERNDLPQGDELLHIFQIINEKTGVDCLAIDLTREEANACVFSHG